METKVLGDRVLVHPSLAEKKTASGIIIPDTAKQRIQSGIIVKIGKDVQNIKIGDSIIFGRAENHKVTVEGKECLIVRESDIHGILEEEKV